MDTEATPSGVSSDEAGATPASPSRALSENWVRAFSEVAIRTPELFSFADALRYDAMARDVVPGSIPRDVNRTVHTWNYPASPIPDMLADSRIRGTPPMYARQPQTMYERTFMPRSLLDYAWPSLYQTAASLPAELLAQQEYIMRERDLLLQEAMVSQDACLGHLVESTLATNKAKKLLADHLTSTQLHDYEMDGYFMATGNMSGHVYRICHGSSMNISRVDEQGGYLVTYCIQPSEHVPHEDVMLAQKLLIETNEALFLATANVSDRQRI